MVTMLCYACSGKNYPREMRMAATVLVVEDEPAIQELIAYNSNRPAISRCGPTMPSRPFALVQDALPDLVLLDWMLPGLSGIELARRLRATGAPSRSPSSCSRPAPTSRTS